MLGWILKEKKNKQQQIIGIYSVSLAEAQTAQREKQRAAPSQP